MDNNDNKQKFVELDVEKLNIVDSDGRLRMSLFNKERMPQPITEGETGERINQVPGMLFYNGEGDECGGLTFHSRIDANGDTIQSVHLSFDRYHGDQVVTVDAFERNGLQVKGFAVKDQPGHVERAWMGKSENGTVSISLADSKGQERIRMSIDSNDTPRMEFLNDKGEVIYTLPPQ